MSSTPNPLARRRRSHLRVEMLESRLQPSTFLPGWGVPDGVAADLAELEASGDYLFDSLFADGGRHEHFLLDLTQSAATSGVAGVTLRGQTLAQGSAPQAAPAAASQASAAEQTAQLVTVAGMNPVRVSRTGADNAVPVNAQFVTDIRALDVSADVRPAALSLQRLDLQTTAGAPPTVYLSSYLGADGEDGLNALTFDYLGNYYVSGYVEAAGKINSFIAQVDPSFTMINWAVGVANPNPGRDEFAGVALSLDHTLIYVVGSVDNGTGDPNAPQDGVVFALNTADGTPAAGVMLPGANFTGVAVGADGSVYAAGSVYSALDGGRFAGAIHFDAALSLPPLYATFVSFPGASLSTKGSQSVAVDEFGNTYIAAVYTAMPGENQAAAFSLDAGGVARYGFFYGNQTPGDAGGMMAVVYDGGFLYVAGHINNAENNTPLHTDLILAKFTADAGSEVWGFRWYVDNRLGSPLHVGDWGAGGLGLLNGNEPVVSGYASDPVGYPAAGEPPTQGADICTTHFGPNGNTTTLFPDGDPENCFGGSGTDRSLGMVLFGPFPFLAGVTDSPDFPVTQGAFAGGLSDGLVAVLGIL